MGALSDSERPNKESQPNYQRRLCFVSQYLLEALAFHDETLHKKRQRITEYRVTYHRRTHPVPRIAPGLRAPLNHRWPAGDPEQGQRVSQSADLPLSAAPPPEAPSGSPPAARRRPPPARPASVFAWPSVEVGQGRARRSIRPADRGRSRSRAPRHDWRVTGCVTAAASGAT